MADDAMNPSLMKTMAPAGEAGALVRAAFTPIERARGRFLRAPDHDAGTGGEAPAASAETGAAPADDVKADAPKADGLDDATIMGGGEKADDKPAGDDAKPDDAKADDDKSAGPPEKYELTMPDGVKLDEKSWAVAEPIFREIGLNNEQANKLAAVAPQLFAERDKAVQEHAQSALLDEVIGQRKAWAQETQNDPEYGGAKFEASKADAARFIDTFGRTTTADGKTVNVLRQVMDDTGIGNHPALFAAFAKAGAELAEDKQPSGNPVDGKPKTLGEVFYPASG